METTDQFSSPTESNLWIFYDLAMPFQLNCFLCNSSAPWASWSLFPTYKTLNMNYIYLPFLWASLVAQLVKNPPAMWETWFQSLGWEDPLEKGMASHSSILAWRIPMDRGAWWAYSPWGCKERDTTEQLSTQSMQFEAWLSERRHISEGLRIIREFQGIIRSVFRHLCPLIC